jgi:hypothetical protein
MPERTDTRGFRLTPAGRYKFKCTKAPVKKLTPAGHPFYLFEFEYVADDGTIQEHREMLFPSMAGPLLTAFGFEEIEKGVYEWEKPACVGKTVEATIAHEPDKKNKSVTRCRMIDIVETLPF